MSEHDAREDCCAAVDTTDVEPAAAACPSCGAVGRLVPDATIVSMLPRESALRLLGLERRFCKTPSCSVLYYGPGGRSVDKREARVRVAVKEGSPPMTVCYCFGVSAEDLQREVGELGEAPSRDRIKREIRAGTCDCERKNPSGSCCLGEVNAIVKLAMAAKKKDCCG